MLEGFGLRVPSRFRVQGVGLEFLVPSSTIGALRCRVGESCSTQRVYLGLRAGPRNSVPFKEQAPERLVHKKGPIVGTMQENDVIEWSGILMYEKSQAGFRGRVYRPK